MDPRVIYETWAPPDGRWSPWAKPVLFAHLPRGAGGLPAEPPQRASGLVPLVEEAAPSPRDQPGGSLACRLEGDAIPGRDTALVLDLPGLESIDLGLDLVRLGFR